MKVFFFFSGVGSEKMMVFKNKEVFIPSALRWVN
jgi:hypothetical protein